jgi:hypothetical protein
VKTARFVPFEIAGFFTAAAKLKIALSDFQRSAI